MASNNKTSAIDPLVAAQPMPSRKRSLNIMSTIEYEIDAITFEGAGINTAVPKDKPSIVLADNADFGSCYGQVRPGKPLVLASYSRMNFKTE